MTSFTSLVWVIAASVVAVPLISTVVWPLAQEIVRRRTKPMRSQDRAAASYVGPWPDPPPSVVEPAGIDVARAEASSEASALNRLREHVDAHPDEACAILRNWLNAA